MEALAPAYLSEEEFWALEERSETKHEYFDGEIFAMASGTNKHAVLCANAICCLGIQLRGRECCALGGNQLVKIEATGLQTYADVLVCCQPMRFQGPGNNALLTPIVLIEVLSDSTSAYDRGGKFVHYQQIESLRDYIVAEQDQVYVQHFHRVKNNGWLMRTFSLLDDELTLESINCTLPLREWYDGVEVPDGPPPLRLSEN